MIKHNTREMNELIHQRLRAYNRQYWRCLRDYNYHIEKNGELIAGIVAGSSFETLEIEFLFVEEQYRKQGYGHALLRHVEELAKADGLKHVFLNTYSFQAPCFYEKEGYRQLFKLENAFGEYSQYFFWKDL